MSREVANDKLVVIRIEGMHCAKCEKKIKQAMVALDGIHEVEVDFNSRQASVLYDGLSTTIATLMETVQALGYHATGYSVQQSETAPAASAPVENVPPVIAPAGNAKSEVA